MFETSCLTNFRCTGLQFSGVGPIWLIRELPCKNLQCWGNSFKGHYYCMWSSTFSKMPKKRRKNVENRLFSPKPGFRQSWTKVLGTVLQYPCFSVISRFPLKTVHPFRKFLAVLPPPTLYKIETRRKFWIHVSNIVCGVRGGVVPVWIGKRPRNAIVSPKTFVHDWSNPCSQTVRLTQLI